MSRITDTIKRNTPWAIRNLSRKIKRTLQQRHDSTLTCKEVFTRIYATNAWGGEPGEIYSGPGSGGEAAKVYADAVNKFINSMDIQSVVDIGCGDFRVGKAIADSGVNYTGIDIVDSVIARNNSLHAGPGVQFLVRDIIEDELPEGDLCLAREILQHLSNAQIQRVLEKLSGFKYLIVTDHQPPAHNLIPNLDKPHGGYIRIQSHSALVLDKPPFNLPNVELFLSIPAPQPLYDPGERIVSFLIRTPQPSA